MKLFRQTQTELETANLGLIATRYFGSQEYKWVQIHKDNAVSDY